MVRGCQKRIVYLKNTGSDVFDEAYFIINDKVGLSSDDVDMVKEANKILDECRIGNDESGKFSKITGWIKTKGIAVLSGLLIGAVMTFLIK